MKWIVEPPAQPKLGDKKVLRKFAWFPIRIGHYRVWLEQYEEEQEFVEEVHEFCNDCSSPLTPCDTTPRRFWKISQRELLIPYC